MPTLVELREEIAAKATALHDVFAEAGPTYDLSKITSIDGDDEAKAAEIRRRNDELTDLGKKRDALASLVTIGERAEAEARHARTPVGKLALPNGKPGAPLQADGAPPKSLGELFVESAAYTGYQKASRSSPAVEVAGLRSLLERKTVLTTTGFAPETTRIAKIVETAMLMPHVADLIPDGTTSQAAVVFMEETTATNAAAPVAEGALKPESALAFTERTAPVRKIATVLPVTDELFDDAPAMRSYVEARLRTFLQLAEDNQLLHGTGVAPQLLGLLATPGIQTLAVGVAPDSVIDAVYRAMMQIETVAFVPASGAIFHPLDWQAVRLAKAEGSGTYLWGPPMDPGPERIWGLPVVRTTQMTQNTVLVGAFDTCTQFFRREGITFAVSSEHADFFQRNQLMLRVEERAALVTYRPTGLCTVTNA